MLHYHHTRVLGITGDFHWTKYKHHFTRRSSPTL